LWQKQSLFEEAARVPLIVAAPGQKRAGESSTALAELIDVYPTLADVCGLTPPKNLPGRSLKPQLDDPAAPGKPAAFTQVRRNLGAVGGKGAGKGQVDCYSVRTDRWRFTRWGKNGEAGQELYDHQADPHEYTNLATKPEYASTVAELNQLLPQ
jgi:uncharacterized sulfatase